MTIIQEMRLNAKALRDMPAFGDIYAHIAGDMDRWADWLEKSGALVAVPDGEVITVAELKPGQHFAYNRNHYRSTSWVKGRLVAMQTTDEEPNTFDGRTIVQPVKLLPITEATP